MLLLGVDFETTGLNIKTDYIIEVGAAVWDTQRNTTLKLYSDLLKIKKPLGYEVTKVTGILNEDLLNHGVDPKYAFLRILTLLEDVDYIVAHNGTNFDKPILEEELKRYDIPAPAQPWLDTMKDLPLPENITSKRLGYLAADHGFLNPFPHRALSDVLTMLKVLSHYDINKVISISSEADITLVADVSKPWLDRRPEGKKGVDLVKARGYRFNGGTKQWQKVVKESNVDEEKRHGEFHVRSVET